MCPYKRIEFLIGKYICENYRSAVEIGAGANLGAARLIVGSGIPLRCTDIRPISPEPGIEVLKDDIFEPNLDLYRGAEVLYAIRPGIEMVPPMIALAREIDADLLVYHLGFEVFLQGGEIIDCGVILHRYHARQNPGRED
jgi:uncharacterized protein